MAGSVMSAYGHMAIVLCECSILYMTESLLPKPIWCILVGMAVLRWLDWQKYIASAVKNMWSLISTYFRYETSENPDDSRETPELQSSTGDILMKVIAGGLLTVLFKIILNQAPGDITVKKFIDSADLSFKVNRSLSVIPQLLESTTSILQQVVVYLAGHNMTDDQALNDEFEEIKGAYSQWGMRVSELSSSDTKLECEQDPALRLEILRLRDEADVFAKTCLNAKWPASFRSTFNLHYNNIKELANHVKIFKRVAQWRIDPWCIWIAGEPRIGKSFLASSVISQILRLADQTPTSHYARGESDHWDNYNGQFVVYWDDFGQWKGEVAKTRYQEFINARSNQMYITKQADLADKGRPFEAGALVMTSNFVYPDCGPHVHSIDAVNSRRHLVVEAILQPDYLTMLGAPDTDKIFEHHQRLPDYDHLRFRLMNPRENGCLREGMTFLDLQRVIAEKFQMHYHQQQILLQQNIDANREEVLERTPPPRVQRPTLATTIESTKAYVKTLFGIEEPVVQSDPAPKVNEGASTSSQETIDLDIEVAEILQEEEELEVVIDENQVTVSTSSLRNFLNRYKSVFYLMKEWKNRATARLPVDVMARFDEKATDLYYKMLRVDAKIILKTALAIVTSHAGHVFICARDKAKQLKETAKQRFLDSMNVANHARKAWKSTRGIIDTIWEVIKPHVTQLKGQLILLGAVGFIGYLHHLKNKQQSDKLKVLEICKQVEARVLSRQVGRMYAANLDQARSYVETSIDPLFRLPIRRNTHGMRYVKHPSGANIYLYNPKGGMGWSDFKPLQLKDVDTEVEAMTLQTEDGRTRNTQFMTRGDFLMRQVELKAKQQGITEEELFDRVFDEIKDDDPETGLPILEEEGGVSGDPRTGRQHKTIVHARQAPTRTLPQTQSGDRNLADQKAVIARHLYRIRTSVGECCALATNGHNLIVNVHMINPLKDNDLVTLIPSAFVTPITISFKRSDVVRIGDSDIAIWKNIARLPPAPRFSKYFVSNKDLAHFVHFDGLIYSRGSDGYIHEFHGSISAIRETKWYGSPYAVRTSGQLKRKDVFLEGWTSDISTDVGTCGSIWFAKGNQQRKAVGIHMAGFSSQKSGAFAALLTQEDIEQSLDWDIDTTCAELEMQSMCVSDNVNSIVGYGYEVYGACAPKDASFAPGRTQIEKAKTHGLVAPPVTEPAILTPKDPRNPTKTSPFRNALKKYESRTVPFPSSSRRIVTELVEYRLHKALGKCQVHELTMEEVVNGLPMAGYAGLEMDSSPGFRWKKKRPAGVEGKAFLFDERIVEAGFTYRVGEDGPEEPVPGWPDCKKLWSMKPELDLRVWDDLQALKRGERPFFLWEHQLKDERRPIKKIKDVNTRIFTMAQVNATVVARALTMNFTARFYESVAQGFSAVGIDTHGPLWAKLQRELLNVSNKGCDGDFGKFDGTLDPDLIMDTLRIIARWQDHLTLWRRDVNTGQWTNLTFDREELERALIVLAGDFIHTYQIVMDCLHRKWQGNPSGNCLTVVLNTIVNAMYLRLAFAALKTEAPLYLPVVAYDKFVKDWYYGDDNVLAICPDILDWFNPSRISEYFATLGIDYTTADKSGIKQQTKDVRDFRFLKRGWRPDEEFRHLKWDPIDPDTINELTNWIRSCDDPDLQLREQFGNALYESAAHGRIFYCSFLEKCNAALKQVGLDEFPNEYDELRTHRIRQLAGVPVIGETLLVGEGSTVIS